MSRTTPKMRDFAERLIAYEALENSPPAKSPAAFPLVEKLRPQLATIMGNAGFRALFARALALAGAEVPWLRAVQVKADGVLEGLDEPDAKRDKLALAEGEVVLVSSLIGLLVTLIGEYLTLHLLREVWPHLPEKDFKLCKGDTNENT